jgi:Leucine Rich Repeat (LRR) protein
VGVYSPGATLTADRLAALGPAAGEIVELDLHGSGLEDANLAGFERFTQLTKLRLSDNRLTDGGLESLARLPNLESLNLYANSGITDAGLHALARSASLKRLYLWETGVSEAGVAELEELRPDLAVQMGAATPLTTAIEPGN